MTETLSTAHEPAAPEITAELPRRPEWDHVRETVAQISYHGRLFLRGQVRLGMLLSGLKKANSCEGSGRRNKVADSATYTPWPQIVLEETGMARRQGDEFIRLYDATVAKLKRSKTLELPEGLATDALVLFQTENALALSETQWIAVDELIGSLTTGETQASLMQELGIIPKAKAMPRPDGSTPPKDGPEATAGQLAFHFFESFAAPLINARCNPDYKKLLLALPLHSTPEHPLSLATLKAEARALLRDIEDAEQFSAQSAKGKTITV